MMNEETKALIEREAIEYSERIKKNTAFNSNERIAATAAFKRGASIISEAILDKFRWRKTEKELPELRDEKYQIIARTEYGEHFSYWIHKCANLSILLDSSVEWMPIPQ